MSTVSVSVLLFSMVLRVSAEMSAEQMSDEDLIAKIEENQPQKDITVQNDIFPSVIRAVHQIWPPLLYEQNANDSKTFSGYNFEVFETICDILGVKIEYVANKYQGVWAWKNPVNGTWIGMLKMLADDEADACVPGAAMTPERTEISDFTIATTHFTSTIFVQTPSRKQANIENYLQEFSLYSWGVIVATFLLCIATLILANHVIGKDNSWRNSIGIVFYAFINKSLSSDLRQTSTQTLGYQSLVFIIFCIWLMLMVIYRCQMNAVLAVSILPFPINSLSDALDLNYGVTFFKGGVIDEMFSLSPPGSPEHRAHQKYLNDDAPPLQSFDMGIQRVLDGTHVFLQKLETLRAHPAYPCEMVDVKNYKINQDIVFPFKIGHSLLPAFNEQIMKLREAGILNKLWRKYIYTGDKQCDEESGDTLGFENVLSPFFILAFGIGLSILVLILESISFPPKKSTSPLFSRRTTPEYFGWKVGQSADETLQNVMEILTLEGISNEKKIFALEAIIFRKRSTRF